MSDPTTPDFDDPYADAEGRVNDLFAREVGDDIAELLADASLWEMPSSGLGDRIVEAARAGSSPTDAEQVVAPVVDEVPRLAEVVPLSRWRQVRAGLIGAAAAIVLLAAGVVAFSAADDPPAQVAFEAELVPTGLIADVGGDIEVTAVQSGLRVELDAPSLPRRDGGSFYEGWLRLDDDRLVPIGTFHEGGDVTLWAGIELDRVVAMTITREQAVPGASAEQASSGEVVLKVDFPSN